MEKLQQSDINQQISASVIRGLQAELGKAITQVYESKAKEDMYLALTAKQAKRIEELEEELKTHKKNAKSAPESEAKNEPSEEEPKTAKE